MRHEGLYYKCDGCGRELEKTRLLSDIEDDFLRCPRRGGLVLQLEASPAA